MTLRPAVEPPHRSFVLGATIGGGIVLASIVASITRSTPVPAPPMVTVVPAPPIVVPIPVEAPAEPPSPPPAAVRTSAPFIQTQCLQLADEPLPPSCAWDDGFPAISRDGKTIVVKHVDEDGGRGNPNLRIEFFDVATNKRQRAVTILTGDEYDQHVWDKLGKIVEPRVTKLNTQLDGYRSLQHLDNLDVAAGTVLRVEQQDALLRVVDTQTQRAIFHRNFDATVIYPNHKADPESECSGLAQLGEIGTWWDVETKTLVASVSYAYGGCMCGEQTDTFVKRL